MSDTFVATCYDVRIWQDLMEVLEDAEDARNNWRHIWFLRWRYPEIQARARRGSQYVLQIETLLERAWDGGEDLDDFDIDGTGRLTASGMPI